MTTSPAPTDTDAAEGGPSRRPRRRLVAAGIGLALALTACGSDDDAAGDAQASADETAQSEADGDATAAGAETTIDGGSSADTAGTDVDDTTEASSGDGEVPPPEDVAACLSDAGFTVIPAAEILSEQQLRDQMTLFGQVDSLTFDATTTAFAGGIAFFETEELAQERSLDFTEVALAQRVIGTALVTIEAGSDFDAAVAASETCLTS